MRPRRPIRWRVEPPGSDFRRDSWSSRRPPVRRDGGAVDRLAVRGHVVEAVGDDSIGAGPAGHPVGGAVAGGEAIVAGAAVQ